MKRATFIALGLVAGAACAAPVTYQIDTRHTAPSFETDHMGGLSLWRGKFTKTSGNVVLDKEAGTGSVDITIDASSVDLGNEKLESEVRGAEMLDAAKYPTARYKGKLVKFKDGAPTEVEGQFTLHGVTKPLTLKVESFLCKKHPMSGKEVCGANASGTFNRSDFGVSYGKEHGFLQDVKLRISVEAARSS